MSYDQEPIPLRMALSFWETEGFNDLTILKHQRFIHHLANEHVVINGATLDCDGNQSSICPIPSGVFRRSFEFDSSGRELRALGKDGNPITYRDLSISTDHLNALRSLMDDVKKQDIRQDLFDRLANGDLTPKEAEAQAESFGMGPLNSMPDVAGFDPMIEARWSFPMALAWIVWRDPCKVRDYWPRWRGQLQDWLEGRKTEKQQDRPTDEIHSFHLVPHRSPNALLETLRFDCALALDGETALKLAEAETELIAVLANGALDPDGICLASGRRVSIEKSEFRDLELLSDGRDEYLGVGLAQRLYNNPTLKCSEVKQQWLSMHQDPESLCTEWLISLMEENPERGEVTKPDYLAQAMAKFEGLIPAMFKRAWTMALSEADAKWDKGGRPRKKPSE